jgi:primosomal replication protein N''
MISKKNRIIESYQQRLTGSFGRSPLLKATVSKSGRLLDCSQLEYVSPGLGQRLLGSVVEAKPPVSISLTLRTRASRGTGPNETTQAQPFLDEEGQASDLGRHDHSVLYDLLDRRIRRHGEMAKRETGVHAIWLGYPLLFVPGDDVEGKQWILAPVFLWPVTIELDLRSEGRFRVGRHKEAQSNEPSQPLLNVAMTTWVSRQLKLNLPEPSELELQELDWQTLKGRLRSIGEQFQDRPSIDCDRPLESVPERKGVAAQATPRFFNSAVLGYFRQPNEAIMADLAAIKDSDTCEGVVAAFVEGTRLARPSDVPKPPEEDRYYVSPVDFSQERVIWQARQSPGLVVHGPPGTGKSQTIVNLIADALAHQRTVLMICQKQAATRVVLERLRAAGLENLCVEVHDVELNRLAVFRSIRDQVDQLPQQMSLQAAQHRRQLSSRISQLEEELDRYSAALHQSHPKIGLSYRQIKAREGQLYSQLPAARCLPQLQGIIAPLTAQRVDVLCQQIKIIGHLFCLADAMHNPWKHRRPELQESVSLREDVLIVLERLRQLDKKHADYVRGHGARIPLPRDLATFSSQGLEILDRIQLLAKDANSSRGRITKAWLNTILRMDNDQVLSLLATVERAQDLANRIAMMPLDPRWNALNISDVEVRAYYAHAKSVLAHRKRWWRFMSGNFRKARAAIQSFCPEAQGEFLWMTAESLQNYCSARLLRMDLTNLCRDLVPGIRPTNLENEARLCQFPKVVRECLDKALDLYRLAQDHVWVRVLLDALVSHRAESNLLELINDVHRALGRVAIVQDLLDEFFQLNRFLVPQCLQEPYQRIVAGQSIATWVDAVKKGLDGLPALIALDSYRSNSDEFLSKTLYALEDYEFRRPSDRTLPVPPVDLPVDQYGAWWAALVQSAVIRAWQNTCHAECPILVQLTPETHAIKVQQLRELLKEKRALEAETIRSQWLSRQLSYRNQPWKRIFQLRSSKNGESKRLRESVRLSIPCGLLAMRPCWLVNPSVAAQIFPLQAGLFDLVIFDEASQCPIEQAVPAILRGKVLVVSGDEKQLPPTGFFSAKWDAENLEDNLEDTDEPATEESVQAHERRLQQLGEEELMQVEDLLQAAVGNLPEQYLRVHYRSEHPALIEFSNQAFYAGQLEAPPSRGGAASSKRPILYHNVEGTYARRTNRQEAERVLQLLKSFWLGEGRSPTIGVVTFNQPQQDLIQNLIKQECNENPAFATRYEEEQQRQESNQDVGFFVKNLENVQGDERDVMIFSTTFGKDSEGRFYRRFGPVGAVGGERRLNVAVTRAKSQIIIVGSIPIQEIGPALRAEGGIGSQLRPADYLQLYLAYAKAVSDVDEKLACQILSRLRRQASGVQDDGEVESPLEEEVRETVKRLGFQVVSQVGESGFRIDLAVQHPEPNRGYILGIECDGAAYHSDRSARTRDVWRQEILEGRGWTIHRIWSTRWWYHKADETEKLRRILEKALNSN